MEKNLMAIRIVIISILILFNFVAYAQENRQSAIDQERGIVPIASEQNKMLIQTLEKLRNSLATDMKSFHKVNERYFSNFNKGNQTALDKVIEQMNAQNNRLEDTNSIFKSELIPAIEQDMDKINSRVDKLAEDMKASYGLQNEKLSRLIDILKSFAIEQGKIDQVLQNLSNNHSQERILQNQKQITEGLKDLRRKANVNISRSDDILKKLKRGQ